jgi:hypothetical protein
MDVARKGPVVALLVLMTTSCGPSCGRHFGAYSAFVASHNEIRPGMSLREVYEAGLADFMMTGQGANITGRTTVNAEPPTPECVTVMIDIHYGPSDGGGFSVVVLCATNRTPPREVAPIRYFHTKRDFLQGLDAQSSWVKSMQFYVQSPALQIGGAYDSYSFSVDEHGKVATVSAISLYDPRP